MKIALFTLPLLASIATTSLAEEKDNKIYIFDGKIYHHITPC